MTTTMKLKNFLGGSDITPAQASTFYKDVRAFYEKAVEYALAKLLVKDELLRNANFVDFTSRFVEVSSRSRNSGRRVQILANHTHYWLTTPSIGYEQITKYYTSETARKELKSECVENTHTTITYQGGFWRCSCISLVKID